MKNKIKILVSSSISSFLLFSCNTLVTNPNIKDYIVQATTKSNELSFDLGSKNGPSFSVIVNNKNRSFSTKQNVNGYTGKVKSDITVLRIYLVDSNASNLSGTNIKEGPFDIVTTNTGTLKIFFDAVTGTSGTGNINFTNVKAGTYYVAIAAYKTSVSVANNITSIKTYPTGSSTNITSPTSVDLGRFALSTTGGDSSNGVVTVGAMVNGGGRALLYLVNNGTTSLGVTLNLLDAVGATIDATTTITEGSSTIPPTSLQ